MPEVPAEALPKIFEFSTAASCRCLASCSTTFRSISILVDYPAKLIAEQEQQEEFWLQQDLELWGWGIKDWSVQASDGSSSQSI